MAEARIGEDLSERIAGAWQDILARVAAGDLIKVILQEHGLTANHIRAYRLGNPRAYQEWETAREQSADAFAEEALEVARNPMVEVHSADGKTSAIVRLDSSHARTRIDTLKWAARVRNPRAYQDQSKLDVNVKTVDLTAIITAANARLAASKVIEGECARVPDLAELM